MEKAVIFTMLVAVLTGYASCLSDDDGSADVNMTSKCGKAMWTFEVGADDGSRTQLDANNKVVFKKGDSIGVFNNADASENAKFTAEKMSGDTASVAKFNGEANHRCT